MTPSIISAAASKAARTTHVPFVSFSLTPRSLFLYLCLGLLTLLDDESQTRCISLPVLLSAYHSITVGASPSLHYEGTESGPSRRQTSSAMEVGQIADSAYKRRRLMWQLGNRVQERLAQYRLTDAHDLD